MSGDLDFYLLLLTDFFFYECKNDFGEDTQFSLYFLDLDFDFDFDFDLDFDFDFDLDLEFIFECDQLTDSGVLAQYFTFKFQSDLDLSLFLRFDLEFLASKFYLSKRLMVY